MILGMIGVDTRGEGGRGEKEERRAKEPPAVLSMPGDGIQQSSLLTKPKPSEEGMHWNLLVLFVRVPRLETGEFLLVCIDCVSE